MSKTAAGVVNEAVEFYLENFYHEPELEQAVRAHLQTDRWDQMRARLKTRVASGNLKRSTVAKMLLSVMDDLEKEGAEA